MTIGRARVVRGEGASFARIDAGAPTRSEPGHGARIVRREIAQAREQAARIVADAEARADTMLALARQEADAMAPGLERQARAGAQAELAEAWAAMRAREARADRDAADRTLSIARLLAERLLRSQLSLAPESLVPMAREALAQFWAAGQVTLRACPQDTSVLKEHLEELGVPAASLRLIEDAERERGSLLVRTSIGELDTDLGVQLDRLVEALRRSAG